MLSFLWPSLFWLISTGFFRMKSLIAVSEVKQVGEKKGRQGGLGSHRISSAKHLWNKQGQLSLIILITHISFPFPFPFPLLPLYPFSFLSPSLSCLCIPFLLEILTKGLLGFRQWAVLGMQRWWRHSLFPQSSLSRRELTYFSMAVIAENSRPGLGGWDIWTVLGPLVALPAGS